MEIFKSNFYLISKHVMFNAVKSLKIGSSKIVVVLVIKLGRACLTLVHSEWKNSSFGGSECNRVNHPYYVYKIQMELQCQP